MRRRLISLFALSLALLSSCGEQKPFFREASPVTVEAKRYIPGFTDRYPCSEYKYDAWSGEYKWVTSTCSRDVPEKWVFLLRQCDHRDHEDADSKGCIRMESYVSWGVYTRYDTGTQVLINDLR